ncbi:hypothetical protein P3L51_27365 [Streptomyces sp. PSRA5]|uniref:hypothetical protein n=1 Tax=Streptomyces panacea TaxID=3035064 RepID=UPI00339CA23F
MRDASTSAHEPVTATALDELLRGYGHEVPHVHGVPHVHEMPHVTGDEPYAVHRAMAEGMDTAPGTIALIQRTGRGRDVTERARRPVIDRDARPGGGERDARPLAHVLACAPEGARRRGSNPRANGGPLPRDLPVPALEPYAVQVDRPGASPHEPTRVLGDLPVPGMEATSERREHGTDLPEVADRTRRPVSDDGDGPPR